MTDYKNAVKVWEGRNMDLGSLEKQQVACDNLNPWLEKVLLMIQECTGKSSMIIVSGPELKSQGNMVVTCMHQGVMPGSHPIDFNTLASSLFTDMVIPKYIEFLKIVHYTKNDVNPDEDDEDTLADDATVNQNHQNLRENAPVDSAICSNQTLQEDIPLMVLSIVEDTNLSMTSGPKVTLTVGGEQWQWILVKLVELEQQSGFVQDHDLHLLICKQQFVRLESSQQKIAHLLLGHGSSMPKVLDSVPLLLHLVFTWHSGGSGGLHASQTGALKDVDTTFGACLGR
ncbi:hypothetical protein BS47DRAFT_1360756 [Hydnum rufescens UP504]|uniref:Uncharacterized protein n=1 Tax=Hydnum rufescens UP504 TaxID=1448309 RepID=A0A9P6B181_9AGAM|nr:hypothetical protein BS47DRAFT_1360756 [Hydnum rufescens UP504]